MKKITSLYNHLINSIEHFKTNPDRLFVTVKEGSLVWGNGSLSHKQSYKALVEIDEYPVDMDESAIFLPLIEWYSENQDDFDPKKPPINFETYKLNNDSISLIILVDLEESVVVKMDENGKPLINVCDPNL